MTVEWQQWGDCEEQFLLGSVNNRGVVAREHAGEWLDLTDCILPEVYRASPLLRITLFAAAPAPLPLDNCPE